MDHSVMGDDGNSVMSRLRVAAVNAAEAMIAHSGDDPAKLVALAQQIGLRENRTAECTTSSAPSGNAQGPFPPDCWRLSLS
jgi:hypothetical protein